MNNPYLSFLKRNVKIILGVFILIGAVNIGATSISNIIMSSNETSTEPIRIMIQATQMSMFICFLFGIVSIIKMFNGAMSIRGDRVGFLKALAVWSIIIALFLSISSILFEIGSKVLIEYATNREVYIISDVLWINLEDVEIKVTDLSLIWFVKTIILRTLTNILMISVGYMVGAIEYRLKIKYNILLFIVIPVIFVGYLINQIIRSEEIILNIIMNIMTMMLYIIEKPMIYAIIQVVLIGICTFIGTKLLIKAPIKDYAHDLI